MVDGKQYFNAERKMVLEWTRLQIPRLPQWLWPRMGPWPKGENNRLYQVVRPTADVVFHVDKFVHIVEFKVEPDARAVGQLLLYRQLYSSTPEFSAWKNMPMKLMFVTSRKDKEVEDLCREEGIKYAVFCPPWLNDYLKKRYARQQP